MSRSKTINLAGVSSVLLVLLVLVLVAWPGTALAHVVERVSVDGPGSWANASSQEPSISADGGYVAFVSEASNLVGGDTNGRLDVFVYDRDMGVTTRVSVDSDGAQANAESNSPSISADGRYVAFYSYADNLAPDDTNGSGDIFVYDRESGETTRVSVDSDGNEVSGESYGPSISADGRYVAFASDATQLVPDDTNGCDDVFIHDRKGGETTRVSLHSGGKEGDLASLGPSVSADGRYVAFFSWASTLVEDDTNGVYDVFVHDRDTKETKRVSLDGKGKEADQDSWWPSISADGRYVAFSSEATNLVSDDTNARSDVFVYDRDTEETIRASVDSELKEADGESLGASISANGRYVAFSSEATNLVPDDTNARSDVFVHDCEAKETTRVSVSWTGVQGNDSSYRASISAAGSLVAFYSAAGNLVPDDTNGARDIFVHDRDTETTTRASVSNGGNQANHDSSYPSMSADGRYVAFYSWASNLVLGDTNGELDVFVRDRNDGTTTRVSVSSGGVQGNGYSATPYLSPDGRYVVFTSEADNLVPGDTNGSLDAFLHDRDTGTTTRVSMDSADVQGNANSYGRCISDDGRFVAFDSFADNLVFGDTNEKMDSFVRDLVTGQVTRVSVDSEGNQGNDASGMPAMSADGRYVAFRSNADNLVSGDTNGGTDVFVHDRLTGETTRVSVSSGGSQGSSSSAWPSISADGRYVAFESNADNLVSGDTNGLTDLFVHDRQSGTTSRVSVATDGTQANAAIEYSKIGADGRYVVFDTQADNLVPGDTNGRHDVFVHDSASGVTTRVSVSSAGDQANNFCLHPCISANGRFAAFDSYASNLVPGDTNAATDVFVAVLPPTISGLAPTSGPTTGTTSVVIAGTNLTDASAVTFGGAPASDFAVDSDTQITATAPPHVAGLVQVRVTTPHGSSADTAADDYTYVAPGVTYSSLRGVDRFDTAIRVSQATFPDPLPAGSGVVLAPGWESYQEALCGSPLAAAWGGPVLLSSKTVLYGNVSAELVRLDPDQVFCIGLTGTAVADAVRAILPAATVTCINGTGTTANIVYDMSYQVAKALGTKVGDMSAATAIVTTGTNFPDAIGVSPLACAKKWPILLTNNAQPALHTSSAQALSELGITHALKVGTYATLPLTITGVGNCSGVDRYYTNAAVAIWAKNTAGLSFAYTGITTGDKFPDALAAGPYLARDNGTLLLSPLNGPLPPAISALITANRLAVQHVTFVACIEPVVGQVKALLP